MTKFHNTEVAGLYSRPGSEFPRPGSEFPRPGSEFAHPVGELTPLVVNSHPRAENNTSRQWTHNTGRTPLKYCQDMNLKRQFKIKFYCNLLCCIWFGCILLHYIVLYFSELY